MSRPINPFYPQDIVRRDIQPVRSIHREVLGTNDTRTPRTTAF